MHMLNCYRYQLKQKKRTENAGNLGIMTVLYHVKKPIFPVARNFQRRIRNLQISP